MLKREEAFTLIEMLIVLMIITVLILLIVPTIAKRAEGVQDKGCEALIKTVQTQANVYQLETGEIPDSLEELEGQGYITEEQFMCENKQSLEIDADGIVHKSS